MKIQTDLWRVGIVKQPIASLLEAETAWPASAILWLPDAGSFRFIADPFGLWREEGLTVFVEAFDYRTKCGEIHYYQYDAAWQLVAQGVALKKPFHLSYPYLIEADGALYMLPEAHQTGRLTLYRCLRFPDQWEEAAVLLDAPAIDASIIQYAGRWWMFYALPGDNHRAQRELHVAYADQLTGRWIEHPKNPVRSTRHSSRPGGTPFIHHGALYVPTQDCLAHYGNALNILQITQLSREEFSCTEVKRLSAEGLPTDYTDGIHTLSACGNVLLIDVKKIDRSLQRIVINWQRRWRRVWGKS